MSILSHVRRCILEIPSRRDAKRLSDLFEELRDYEVFVSSGIPDLKPQYEKYTKAISTPDMAVSLRTSQFLFVLAKAIDARRILDLGSGFSSFVFRLYSMGAGKDAVVYSVDDNEKWLAKTRGFLGDLQVHEDFLLNWQSFRQSAPGSFDLIFHDLGNMALRAQALPFVISLLDAKGILVLDDMHKTGVGPSGGYPGVARRAVREAGLTLLSAHHYTLDRYKRFCEIAIRLPIEYGEPITRPVQKR